LAFTIANKNLTADEVQVLHSQLETFHQPESRAVKKRRAQSWNSAQWKLKEAITALNGQRMGGRVITVNEALPQRNGAGPAPARNGRPASDERRYRAS